VITIRRQNPIRSVDPFTPSRFMITVPRLRNIALLLYLSFVALHADDAGQKAAPPPTEMKTWRFEADLDRRSSVTLFLGETPENVINKMGEPRGRSKKKKDPAHEDLRYIRKVPGPVLQKQVMTQGRIETIRYQVVFTDEITLYFKNDALQNVKTHRTRSDDQDSLPPFMRG